jgi:DNA-binding SARP family transcriptional activator
LTQRITQGHRTHGDRVTPMMYVKLFGSPTVVTDDGSVSVTDLGGVKPRQILEILALSAGSPVPKDRLAELLWDGQPPKSYVATLEGYVCVLRRRLGQGRGRRAALATTTNGYLLDPTMVRVDLTEFRALAESALSAPPAKAVELSRQALALVTGELLVTEAYADWAEHERALVRHEVVTACTRAAGWALQVGDVDLALTMGRRAVQMDPIAEAAWRYKMQALRASGRRGEALRAYAKLRKAMTSELGIEPGAESRALYLELLQNETAAAGPGTGNEHVEVSTLLGLLRQALEAIPGVDVPLADDPLAEVAVRWLRVSAAAA